MSKDAQRRASTGSSDAGSSAPAETKGAKHSPVAANIPPSGPATIPILPMPTKEQASQTDREAPTLQDAEKQDGKSGPKKMVPKAWFIPVGWVLILGAAPICGFILVGCVVLKMPLLGTMSGLGLLLSLVGIPAARGKALEEGAQSLLMTQLAFLPLLVWLFLDPAVSWFQKDQLMQACRNGTTDERMKAVDRLGDVCSGSYLEHPDIVQCLMISMRDPEAGVRAKAARSLATSEAPEAADVLVAGLQDSTAEVRRSAAYALGRIAPSSARQPLTALAQSDSDSDVRKQAEWALGRLPREPAPPPEQRYSIQDRQTSTLPKEGATPSRELGETRYSDAEGSALATGDSQVEAGIYTNMFVGIRFLVPPGWHTASHKEIESLVRDGVNALGPGDSTVTAVGSQIPGKILLMLAEKPFTSDVQAPNPNIVLAVINSRDMKNEVRSGADYLRHVARGMSEAQPGAAVSEITTCTLGGLVFHRLDVGFPVQDTTVRICQMARVHNDYLVILNLSAYEEANLTDLLQVADGLHLSAVTQEVDNGTAGKSFRAASTLRVRQTGWNLLQLAGVLVIGLAILRFSRPLGAVAIVGALIYYFFA